MPDEIFVTELLQKWVNTIKNGDPKQVANLYHENGILLGTFSPKERVGHELILEYFENLLQSPVEVEIVSEHPHIFESSAVNSGLYNLSQAERQLKQDFHLHIAKMIQSGKLFHITLQYCLKLENTK